MPEDLSYLLSKPTEEEEQRVQEALQRECIRAISTYLEEVATTMDTNNIPHITADNLRAMASTLFIRINDDQNQNA